LIGVGFFDFSALNARLAASGYDRVTSAPVVIGGEGHAVLKSGLVLGGHGVGVATPTGSGPGQTQTSFGAGYGMFDFGFAPVRSQHLLVLALAGFGGYSVGINLGDNQGAKFDDVLADPRRSTSLSHAGLLFGLTLGVDGRVPLGKPERGQRGFFTVGLRVGGLYGLPLGNWTLPQGARVSAGPYGGLRGGVAMVAIGFGGGSVASQVVGTP
jgi:hypothetical protein